MVTMSDHLVPGVMRCAKCEFQLVRTVLYVNSGTAGSGDNKTEPCPNGCGPLWPVTWKQWAEEAQKTAERFFEEAKAERAKVDDLSMLVRRLAHALDKPSGNTLLARQALDYLRRHGVGGIAATPRSSAMKSPIETLIDRSSLKCTLCGAGMGKCACGWSYERGGKCRNPVHASKKNRSRAE